MACRPFPSVYMRFSFFYCPLGNSKPLGAIGKPVILQRPHVLLSENVKEQGMRWKRMDSNSNKKIEEREKVAKKQIGALILSSFSTCLVVEVDYCLTSIMW